MSRRRARTWTLASLAIALVAAALGTWLLRDAPAALPPSAPPPARHLPSPPSPPSPPAPGEPEPDLEDPTAPPPPESAPSQAPQTQEMGELSGRVCDADGIGRPAELVALEGPGEELRFDTGGDGAFTITLPKGVWVIEARAEGYAPARVRGVAWPGRPRPLEDLVLRRPGALRLTTTDGEARRLAGVDVTLIRSAELGVASQSLGRTDPRGSLVATGLAPGVCYLRLRCEGYGERFERGVIIPAAGELELTLALSAVARIAGRITGGVEGAGKPFVRVLRGGETLDMGWVDEEGGFRFEGAPGPCEVYAEQRQSGRSARLAAELVLGSERWVELRIALGARLEGQLLDAAGQPLAQRRITLTHAELPARELIETDAEGRFEAASLSPGEYLAAVRLRPSDEQASGEVTERIQVPEAGASVIITLPPLGAVTGRVVDASEAPLGQVRVRLSRGGALLGEVDSDAQGRFRIDAIPPGPSALTAELKGAGLVALRRLSRADLDAEVLLQLRPGQALRGRLLSPEGAPLAEAPVILESEDALFIRSGRSDAEGRFVVERLPPGSYELSIMASWLERQQVERPQPMRAPPRRVTIGASAPAELTWTLERE